MTDQSLRLMKPFVFLFIFTVVTTIAAVITAFRMRRRIGRAIGRKVTETELTSLNTWMNVDEAEQATETGKPQHTAVLGPHETHPK
jgi:hypothetical protein